MPSTGGRANFHLCHCFEVYLQPIVWAFLAASDIFRMSCEYKSSGGVTLTFFIAVRCNVAIAAAGVRLPSIHRYSAIIVPWPPGHLAPLPVNVNLVREEAVVWKYPHLFNPSLSTVLIFILEVKNSYKM